MKPQMLFLYKIQPTRKDMLSEGLNPQEDAIISDHFRYLQDLTARGIVCLAGRTLTADADAFGIIIFQADSEERAQEIMENDPAVCRGVMKAVLFPFRIALWGRSEMPPS